jgi:ABC-2 type transport system permease protein
MNWSIVEQVFIKDLQELSKNRYVFFSMLFLPVLLVSITIVNIYAQINSPPVSPTEIAVLISTFSEIIILIPAIVSVLIGATSVVIEKNNRSLEPLLATPITDTELLMGKALAPFIPAMILGYAAYGAIIPIIDYLTFPVFGGYILPTYTMLYQMFVMAPLVGLFGTFVALFISTKIKDVRAAQQVSTLAVMPLFIILIIGSITFASTFDLLIVVTVILAFAVVGFARLTIRQFNRESILISWK